MLRRTFLQTAAGAGLGYRLSAQRAPVELRGNRFITFNSVIRVNQIEVSRTKNLGFDENEFHTPENVKALRDAFAEGWPGGRMTWCLSWLALHDQRPNYRKIREMVVDYHERFGDEITFIPGAYFANAYNSREQVNRDLHDGLALVSELVGKGYRPRAVVAGFLSAANIRYLAEQEGIQVCQGNVWSQYAIDNQDGDGSISYPYYPSTEHFCKPAQASRGSDRAGAGERGDARSRAARGTAGAGDFIDCVNLDGWTVDFLAARRAGYKAGFNSRLGVGPIETIYAYGTETGVREMVFTTGVHFDRGFELNGFAWVTNQWEASLAGYFQKTRKRRGIEGLTLWLAECRKRWPDTKVVTAGEFGEAWRAHYRDNGPIDYRFEERGSGIGGSDAEMEIQWYMNRDFRLARLRNWKAADEWKIIDFTRYDLPAHEPPANTRRWSLLGRINQKGIRAQDKPVRFSELTEAERELVRRRYPEIG